MSTKNNITLNNNVAYTNTNEINLTAGVNEIKISANINAIIRFNRWSFPKIPTFCNTPYVAAANKINGNTTSKNPKSLRTSIPDVKVTGILL